MSRGTYRINTTTTAQSYIDALTLFNQNLPIEITMPDGKTLPTAFQRYCRDLPAIIFELREAGITEFVLQYTASYGQSISNVFPALIFPADFAQKSSPIISDVCGFLGMSLAQMQTVYDVAYVFDRPTFSEPLDRNSALTIISRMRGSAAVELPGLQSIVFQFKGVFAYITYGDTPNVKMLQGMEFDIDDGFSNRSWDAIGAELQRFFLAWKENNYQGKPIPDSAGLVISQDSSASMADAQDEHEQKRNDVAQFSLPDDAILNDDELDILSSEPAGLTSASFVPAEYEARKYSIMQFCLSSGMSLDAANAFLTRIVSADYLLQRVRPSQDHTRVFTHELRDQEALQYVHAMVTTNASLSVITAFNQDETIAFFKLSRFDVTPEMFLPHAKMLIAPPEAGFEILSHGGRALEAGEYLLKSGMPFDVAIRNIVEIKQLPSFSQRFVEMKNGLPIDYVKTFTAAQMRMHGLSRSYEWKELKMTPEKIAELNLPSDFDQYKLKEVLHYLSATKMNHGKELLVLLMAKTMRPLQIIFRKFCIAEFTATRQRKHWVYQQSYWVMNALGSIMKLISKH